MVVDNYDYVGLNYDSANGQDCQAFLHYSDAHIGSLDQTMTVDGEE